MLASTAGWRPSAREPGARGARPGSIPRTLRELQWRRFQRTLAHAAAHSPFYRRKLAKAGAGPEGRPYAAGPVRCFPSRPVKSCAGMRTCWCPRIEDTARRSRTSGSTGQPTVSYFDVEAWWLAKFVLKLRARTACGMRAWDRVALLQEGEPTAGFASHWLPSRRFSVHAPFPQLLPSCCATGPRSSTGSRVIWPCWPKPLLPARTAAGLTSGELLDPATRRRIERVSGRPSSTSTVARRPRRSAWQCERREGYHINAGLDPARMCRRLRGGRQVARHAALQHRHAPASLRDGGYGGPPPRALRLWPRPASDGSFARSVGRLLPAAR